MAGESSSTDENLPYYCYPCQTRIQPITEEMICPHCRDGFVVSNDERDVLVAGENSGQQQTQPQQQNNPRGSMNYNMVETSLRNAMNMGIMQPGVISFSINGQPPTQMTIPGPPAPAANSTTTTTSGSTRASATSPSNSSNVSTSRIFSTLARGNNPTTTNTAPIEAGGLPEIEMIQDIISRVFGNGAEALIGPHAAHNANGTTGREVPATATTTTAAAGGTNNHPRVIDHIPPLWRMGELHGNPQDYAWGQNGFDNIISQLLGQLDNVGPPPATDETINNLPQIKITSKNIEDLAECSVCMDFFKLDEIVKKMPCNHLFHPPCIDPWLNLHNTCPICRKQVGHAVQQPRREVSSTQAVYPHQQQPPPPPRRIPRPSGIRWNNRSSTSGRLPSLRAAASSYFLPQTSSSTSAAETLFFPFFSGSLAPQGIIHPPHRGNPPQPQSPPSGSSTRDPTTGEDQPPPSSQGGSTS